MNREQAIEIIETHSENILSGSLVEQALSMAIDALKAQLFSEDATSDLISRQAALDIFDDYNVSVENGELEAYSRDRKRLCELPSVQPEPTDEHVAEYCKRRCLHVVTDDFFRAAQPEPQWIPVSERLPEVNERVLVTLKDGTMSVRRCIDSGHLKWFYANTIAWMPLPKPFEGGIK